MSEPQTRRMIEFEWHCPTCGTNLDLTQFRAQAYEAGWSEAASRYVTTAEEIERRRDAVREATHAALAAVRERLPRLTYHPKCLCGPELSPTVSLAEVAAILDELDR